MTAVAAKHKYTYRSRAKFWVHLVLMIGSILMIFPFIWTILTSFKTQGEAIMIPPIFFPSHWNFDSYKEEVSTKLSVLTDQLSIDITKVTERIDKVDGDLQSKYSEITKAFRFTSDGLIIGETGNEILLRLDNDVLQFVRNNTPELQITAEGVEAMRIKVSILCIGNVVWTEDENGDVIAS